MGRRSIPPEMLLKALLLQALYTIRSEEQLVEQIRMNLLYRWFLDLSLDAAVWHATTFTKNRERFEKHGLVRKFFDRVVEQALVEQWASDEHFSVDGTLIESYALMKSLRPKESADQRVVDGSDDDDPGNPTVNFRGERRSNATHRSLTDPEARLARKSNGQESRLAHGWHVLMENQNGLVIDVAVSEANGTAERTEALAMLRRSKQRHGLKPVTLAADKGYDAGPFLHELEQKEQVVAAGADPPGSHSRYQRSGASAQACPPAPAHEALPAGAAESEASRGDLRLGQDQLGACGEAATWAAGRSPRTGWRRPPPTTCSDSRACVRGRSVPERRARGRKRPLSGRSEGENSPPQRQ